MRQLSLIDNLKLLFNVILNSKIFMAFPFILLFILIFVILFKQKKSYAKIFFFSVFMILLTVFFARDKIIVLSIFSSFVDNFFINFYFPSFFLYLLEVILLNGLLLFVVLNNKNKIGMKIFDIIFTLFLDLIFVIVVELVTKNGINFEDKLSLYSNLTLSSLIEIHSFTCVIFLVGMFLFVVSCSLDVYFEDNQNDAIDSAKVIDRNKIEKSLNSNPIIVIEDKEKIDIFDHSNEKFIEEDDNVYNEIKLENLDEEKYEVLELDEIETLNV